MRLIGHLTSETHARRFTAFLLVQGVAIRADPESDGWALWIRDEDQVPQARAALESFLASPTDARYASAESEAIKRQRAAVAQQRAAQQNTVDMGDRWRQGHQGPRPLTITLAAISVLVFLLTGGGQDQGSILSDLLFCRPGPDVTSGYQSIRAGEVWRLITPIFVHLSVGHLIFNLLALLYLGSPIERSRGTPWLGLLTLSIAIASNVVQFYWAEKIGFGGLSGVLYGYLGYSWIKSRQDPTGPIRISTESFMFMMFFFFLGIMQEVPVPGIQDIALRILPPIANAAHASGLVLGLLYGWMSPGSKS